MREEMALKGIGDSSLEFLHSFVVLSSSPPINLRERGNIDICFYESVVVVSLSTPAM